LVQLVGPQPRGVERGAQRGLAEVDRGAPPRRVPRGERLEPFVLVERQGEMAPADPHRSMKLLEPIQVEVLPRPQAAKRREQGLLIDEVRRQRACSSEQGDGDGHRHSLSESSRVTPCASSAPPWPPW